MTAANQVRGSEEPVVKTVEKGRNGKAEAVRVLTSKAAVLLGSFLDLLHVSLPSLHSAHA